MLGEEGGEEGDFVGLKPLACGISAISLLAISMRSELKSTILKAVSTED